jgi:hypothetical protein
MVTPFIVAPPLSRGLSLQPPSDFRTSGKALVKFLSIVLYFLSFLEIDMPTAIDATGERHNRLTALRRVANKGSQPRWIFRCECGTEVEASIGAVRSGAIKSCGCLIGEANRRRLLKHGYKGTPTYLSWQNAKGRCFNPRNKRYPDYGGRGITMCQRWRDSFEAFLEDMGERPAGTSIDRYPDNDGNYEPGNCRWARKGQQNGNVRGRTRVAHDGQTYSIKEFAALMNVDFANLYYRIHKAGHDPAQAVEALRAGKWRRIT